MKKLKLTGALRKTAVFDIWHMANRRWSCPSKYHDVLSCLIIMFKHVSSCLIMYHHVSSCLNMSYHVLSCLTLPLDQYKSKHEKTEIDWSSMENCCFWHLTHGKKKMIMSKQVSWCLIMSYHHVQACIIMSYHVSSCIIMS